MFCSRCGNKLPANAEICPKCHYNEETNQIDDTNVEKLYKSAVIKKNTHAETNQDKLFVKSYILFILAYILIFSSLICSIAVYLIYGFVMDIYLHLTICCFISMLGGYLLVKSISNKNKAVSTSKFLILLSIAIIFISLVLILTDLFIKDVSFKEFYGMGFISSILILLSGIEMYLLSTHY